VGRGVARCTAETVAALAELCSDDRLRVLVPRPGGTSQEPQAGVPAWAAAPNVEVRRHPLPGRALFGPAALTGRPRLDRLLGGGLDVVWAPAPAPLALSPGVPLVLTVHDLSWEERPGDFTAYERLWHRLARPRRLAGRAARVAAVSGATATDLERRWALPAGRVVVVPDGGPAPYPAPEPGLAEEVRRRHGLPERFLLHVGGLEPRKAPEILAVAYQRARRDGLEAELAVVGSGRRAGVLGDAGARLLGPVPDRDLRVLYALALALVSASWLEGFGLAPLEALAAGTPSVLSDLPVYDETLGEGALRFPPGDAPALASALLRVAAEPDLRERLVSAGRRAVRALTWRNSAERLRTALAEAANPG
jgi:glycosyltransferase involved in cell wall biosynthesis